MDEEFFFFFEWLTNILVELGPVLVRRTDGVITGMKFDKDFLI
jgi:hypothetical protein